MKINMNATQGPSEKLPTSTKVAGIGENDGKNLSEKERNGGKSEILSNKGGHIQVETGRSVRYFLFLPLFA